MNSNALTLLASMLVTFVLGSVHAFSVFIVSFEALLGLPRSEISLIYSFALVAITLAVLLGYRFYNLLTAWWLIFITCLIAAAGLLLAANAIGWWMLFAGYSLAFGFCNGVGYGFSLQLVDRWPMNRFLVALPLLSAFALLGIGAAESASVVVILLSLVGFSYGSLIAVYPVAISNYFSARGPQVYGRVFIAWGFAGLAAPWSAGLVYDLRGDYQLAMLLAAAIAILSSFLAGIFRLGNSPGNGISANV